MPYVRPDVARLLTMLTSSPGVGMHEVDPSTARTMTRTMGRITELPRGEVARVEELTIPVGGSGGTGGPGGHNIPARLYDARNDAAPGPVILFFHGGGWVVGDLETHDPLCAEIARVSGMTVVSIDYRLAPEHPFPAATEDCLAATRWLAGSPAAIGHPVTGIVPAGDSAGGNLAAVVTQQLQAGLPLPILAQWLIYPGVDMTANTGSMREFAGGYMLTTDVMRWFTRHYMGPKPDFTHDYASPLHVERFAGLPPAMVFTCGLDPLRDQGRAYAAKLAEHGVATIFREAAGQIHGCMNLRAAIPSTQGDLHACLGGLKLLVDEAAARLSAAARTELGERVPSRSETQIHPHAEAAE